MYIKNLHGYWKPAQLLDIGTENFYKHCSHIIVGIFFVVIGDNFIASAWIVILITLAMLLSLKFMYKGPTQEEKTTTTRERTQSFVCTLIPPSLGVVA